MAAERGVAVDRAGFEAAMAEQRARSKAAHVRVGFEGGPQLPDTLFVGYDVLETPATILRIGGDEARELLPAGAEDAVILDSSPFYAEAGGQVGDTGDLLFDGGRARVLDTTYAGGARVHSVRVEEGTLATGATVRAVVDAERRAQVARHHSATHFLNQALREVLGGGVVQRGSFVGPDHATFDFSFRRALTPDELQDIEARVNHHIRADLQRTRRRHVAAGGQGQRRHRAARREVHGEGARRRLRRLVARAVRRHPCRPRRRGRRRDHRGGEQHRPGRAAHRDGRG